MKMTKDQVKALQEKLIATPKNLGETFTQKQMTEAFAFCEGYKTFLNEGKTERKVIAYTVEMAKKEGFMPFDPQKKYKAGDKIYQINRDKALILAVIGSRPLSEGVNMLASHVDSPRIDLKPSPLYEEANLGLLKTHYYGGVKKYQWTAIPLTLQGVVILADGTKVEVNMGQDESDPVLCINDLLPHLGKEQMKRTLNEGIRGEELNVLAGSLPIRAEEAKDGIKLNILNLLHEKYGMTERDFYTAELAVVPAFDARDIGFDRSMIGSYGQDDRVCAYTSVVATLACTAPEKTLVSILADKEEVGSMGNTGLQASYLRDFIADLAKPHDLFARTVLSNSACLSADVTAGFDPTFPEVLERKNAAFLNRGVTLMKYTGSRGKSGSSDATAEFVSKVVRIFDQAEVAWQMGELGKVDQGGGGTVAAYVANLGVDVIDVGVPVLSMHAPFEVTSKLDVYTTYNAFVAFANSK